MTTKRREIPLRGPAGSGSRIRRAGEAAVLAWLAVGPLRAAVVINEVAFDEPGAADWVELLNTGPAAEDLDGWVLNDGDTAEGKEIRLAGPLVLPAGAFLRIMVDVSGVDDRDFSDGSGTVHSGTATTVALAATEDELALHGGLPLSSSTLADFTAWVTDGDYGGAADEAHVHAVAAGAWPAGAAVPLTDTGSGYSLGRSRDGEDTDSLQDWRSYARPTPGAPNAPAASPGGTLTVRPAAFSPLDADPAHSAARFFFDVGEERAVKTIRVLDVRGRVVRVLLDNDREDNGADWTGSAAGFTDWDGRDGAGVVVPIGIYVAILEASMPGGGTTGARRTVAVGRP